jgi:hypothetical protein
LEGYNEENSSCLAQEVTEGNAHPENREPIVTKLTQDSQQQISARDQEIAEQKRITANLEREKMVFVNI